jgi:hypothetical protein
LLSSRQPAWATMPLSGRRRNIKSWREFSGAGEV